jgi:hypothetical protein
MMTLALQLPSVVGRAEADGMQISAPSINSASPDLLDQATSPSVAGVAFDRRFEAAADPRAITFNLAPLVVLQWVGHGEGSAADLSEWAQRAAARVTLGGPPQFVDSLRTPHAGRVTDHVTSELKLRLLDGVREEARAPPITVALALTADNLGTGYGLDRYAGTLIAERDAGCTWTANAGYRILERYRSPERLAETKLGLGAEWRSVRLRAFDVALSGACLLRNHGRVPVWQGAARADLALDGVRLSVATRASDHPEVQGDGRGRGVLSLAYDFSRR